MLANQVQLPDVQVSQEPVKANEVRRSRDNSRTRDFDRAMQDGRREQQGYDKQQEVNTRQADGKEAKSSPQSNRKESNHKEADRLERRDHKEQDSADIERTESTDNSAETSATKEQGESEAKSKSEHDCEHCADKEGKDSSEGKGKLAEQVTEQKLVDAEQSETSQWLNTILSLASDSNAETTEVAAGTEPSEPLSADDTVNVLLVKQVLQSLGSEADLSQLDGQEQISLAQLQSMLSEDELKAVMAQLAKPETQVSSEQEFEQLLAKLTTPSESTESASEQKTTTDIKSISDLINQSKATNDAKAAELQQVSQVVSDKSGEQKLTQISASQTDKVSLDKQESKFKQSSLLNAMQLGNDSKELATEASTQAKPTLAEVLSPTTKVVNIAGTPATNSDTATSIVNNSAAGAAQLATEQMTDKQVGLSELEMTEVKLKDSAESKLASLLGTLAGDEVKTSDQVNRAEKVNVAGVTLDKTLQMPKIETMTQARNEVVVRENILFNKQELANQMQTQVGMMMARNMKSVDIRLDPPELGSMQVKLSVQNDQASVSFVVSNQQAKDALENSLPKLKELLEQQGLQLADSDVNQQQSQAQNGTEDEEQGISQNGLNGDANAEEAELEQQQQMINRAINSPWNVSYYA